MPDVVVPVEPVKAKASIKPPALPENIIRDDKLEPPTIQYSEKPVNALEMEGRKKADVQKLESIQAGVLEELKKMGIDPDNPDPSKLLNMLQGVMSKDNQQLQTLVQWVAGIANSMNRLETNLGHLYVINSFLAQAILAINPYDYTVRKMDLPIDELRAHAMIAQAKYWPTEQKKRGIFK